MARAFRFFAAISIVTGLATAAFGQSNAALKPVATVNGEAIAQWELDMAMAHAPKPPMGLSDAQKKTVQRQLLALMIDELLLQQFLKKNVPAPDASVVQQRLAELDKSLRAKQKTLADYCKETGQTDAQLRTRIATVVQWNAYARKKVTDEDAKRYYDANKDMFDGITVRASHVFLRLAANADTKTQQTILGQIQAVQREVLNGRDFAELAKKYSQDDSTAANGGDLGYFPQRAADPDPFIRTASLMQVGQLSEPIRTDYGYHLIKLTDRKAGTPTKFEDLKEDARLICIDELRAKVIAEQRKAAKLELYLQ